MITPDKLAKLKKSLSELPEMMKIREVVIDENNTILAGNQRVLALKQMGKTTVDVTSVSGWSDERKKEFIIKDNISNGEWDTDQLANDYSLDQLTDWGLDLPNVDDEAIPDSKDKPKMMVTCPDCGFQFEVSK